MEVKMTADLWPRCRAWASSVSEPCTSCKASTDVELSTCSMWVIFFLRLSGSWQRSARVFQVVKVMAPSDCALRQGASVLLKLPLNVLRVQGCLEELFELRAD
eukprot:1465849-Pyramimonas_sp.AAC.1